MDFIFIQQQICTIPSNYSKLQECSQGKCIPVEKLAEQAWLWHLVPLNAGLPSLAKTKFWWGEELNEKAGNKRLKWYFIWIALLIIELWKPNLKQRLECRATKPRENKILVKGGTEWEKGKQVLETTFYLNSFTYHWPTKTWGCQKSFYSIFFSSTICFISNDSPQNCSFPFSYGTIASHNPAGDGLGFTQWISPAASA